MCDTLNQCPLRWTFSLGHDVITVKKRIVIQIHTTYTCITYIIWQTALLFFPYHMIPVPWSSCYTYNSWYTISIHRVLLSFIIFYTCTAFLRPFCVFMYQLLNTHHSMLCNLISIIIILYIFAIAEAVSITLWIRTATNIIDLLSFYNDNDIILL